MAMGRNEWDRRSLLAGGATMALAGCAKCPPFEALPPAPEKRVVRDAHAHFFNGADLPAVRFMKYAIAPKYLEQWPELALAFVNLAVWVLKQTSLTATAEMRLRVPPWDRGRGLDVPAERFAEEVSARIDAVVRDADPALLGGATGLEYDFFAAACDGEDEYDALGETAEADRPTQLSYVRLAYVLSVMERGGRPAIDTTGERIDAARRLLAAIAPVDRRVIAAMCRGGETQSVIAAAQKTDFFWPALLAGATTRPTRRSRSIAALALDIGAIVKWAFQMRQSRCAHVASYLQFAENSDRVRITDCVNLLVDYDEWLGEGPLAGSDHADQIRFWSGMRAIVRPRMTIHSFAGYDPLKDAYGRIGEAAEHSSYLKALVGYFENGRADVGGPPRDPLAFPGIAGLKLYPPMGFQVSGKNALPSCALAGRRIRKNWKARAKGRDFGEEIDAALEHFFARVAEHDIPLLAHARASNQVTEGGDGKAAIRHWLARARHHYEVHGKPLRLCLGHFTVNEMDETLSEIMALNACGKARIYVDLSYGFDDGWGRAARPADARAAQSFWLGILASLTMKHDPGARFILFGTDWIMLEQEPDAEDYVAGALDAFAVTDYWKDEAIIQRVFATNFHDFLATGSPAPPACT